MPIKNKEYSPPRRGAKRAGWVIARHTFKKE